MYHVCSICGTPSIEVNKEAVVAMLKTPSIFLGNEKVYTCVNANCEIAYYTNEVSITINELKKPLFFKDKSDNVPICYCSNLTRGEIKDAVNNGSKTIDDVQEFTRKNITGKCKKENPLGQCCRNSFLFEIEQALGQKPTGISFKPCSCCR